MMTFTLPTLKWLASPNFSDRTAAIDLIVCHDCQGGYTSSVNTFTGDNNGNPVSAHFVLREDGLEATQMVTLDKKAWHCVDFNSRSIGIEMAGFEEKGFSDAEWSADAAMVAYLLHAYRIPCQWAKGGTGPGFCRHYDLGRAGGGHSDPCTDDATWLRFVAKVQAAYASPDIPTKWGRATAADPMPGKLPAPQQQPAQHAPSTTMSVSSAQAALNKAGAQPPLQIDGVPGNKTRNAIVAFQTKQGLFKDGLLNSQTVSALQAYA